MFIAKTHGYDEVAYPLNEWADKFYMEYEGSLCACRWVEIRVPMQSNEMTAELYVQNNHWKDRQISFDIFICGHGIVTFNKGYHGLVIYRSVPEYQASRVNNCIKMDVTNTYGTELYGDELLYRMYQQHNQPPFCRVMDGSGRKVDSLHYWKWDGTKAVKVGVRCPDYIIINNNGFGYSKEFEFESEKRYLTKEDCMRDNSINVIDFEGESCNGYKFLKVSPFI